MSIKRSLCLWIVRDPSIYDDILPTTIFEELEDSKSMLNSIINYEIFQKIWVC